MQAEDVLEKSEEVEAGEKEREGEREREGEQQIVRKENISLLGVVWKWMLIPMSEGFFQTTAIGTVKYFGLKLIKKFRGTK